MRRRTFFLLLLMLLLAVPVVGLVAVHSVDGGYWRGLIADRVEASTGRKLNLGGPFAFTWSLSPTLSLEAVSLANAPGAATPNMLRIGRIEVQLRLWSLLGRQRRDSKRGRNSVANVVGDLAGCVSQNP